MTYIGLAGKNLRKATIVRVRFAWVVIKLDFGNKFVLYRVKSNESAHPAFARKHFWAPPMAVRHVGGGTTLNNGIDGWFKMGGPFF